jgi:hypothetical protein
MILGAYMMQVFTLSAAKHFRKINVLLRLAVVVIVW